MNNRGIEMKANQCGHCYKFFSWENWDSYTPFGCSSYDPPEPYDPVYLCSECSDKLKNEFIESFKRGILVMGIGKNLTLKKKLLRYVV